MSSILTVDDSLSVRQVLAVTLRGGGFDVIQAHDGQQALEIARETPVDLVITDLHMPRMDGIHLVEALRTLPTYSSTPLLLLTTDDSAASRSAGRAAGANGWIGKPFNPGQLLQTVRHLLD